ncbi:hypothetical protein [Methylobacterium platani]|uniref:hypothetical protein n=1 Tax=Methylobacterium platani TaxID=427683 RepID=UPI0012E84DE1|nr:hypothetical protein [Methylobacterium platani]
MEAVWRGIDGIVETKTLATIAFLTSGVVAAVIRDQANSYACTCQSLSDIAPVFRWLFAACMVGGVLASFSKAVQIARGSEAANATRRLSSSPRARSSRHRPGLCPRNRTPRPPRRWPPATDRRHRRLRDLRPRGLVQAAREVLVARVRPPTCPRQDLHSLTIPMGAIVVTRFSTEGVAGVERAAREVH